MAGLVTIAMFPQERWLLMLCVSLYLCVCTYLLTGKNQSYFWFLAAFTSLIIIGVRVLVTLWLAFLLWVYVDPPDTRYANGVLWIVLSLALALATAYIPSSPRPEKVFLRLLRRYFRHTEFLLAGLTPDRSEQTGITRHLRSLLYQNDLVKIPTKLAACAKQIDYRLFPETTPEQVQALVASLYALAFRIEDLVEADGQPQAAQVRERLRDDLQSWHQVIDARLKRRAEDPTQYIEPSADVRNRLADRLARLAASIEETFARSGKDAMRAEDYDNLYRLLGSYRGLSEAAIGYAQLAGGINWARWHEPRFWVRVPE